MALRARSLAVFLILFSVVTGLVLSEVAARIYTASRRREPPSFRLGSAAYGQFDMDHGPRFSPYSELAMSLVTGDHVSHCFGVIASANADGLGVTTTLLDAALADYRIFTAGDSFTDWKRGGLTVPDATQAFLRQWTGRRIADLNYGRGAYGVLQMLAIAADVAPTIEADL